MMQQITLKDVTYSDDFTIIVVNITQSRLRMFMNKLFVLEFVIELDVGPSFIIA